MNRAAADWRTADAYAELLFCDRRAFAWEWLRRSPTYRQMWAHRADLPVRTLRATGLLGWIDPALAAPHARPIWSIDRDPHVLRGYPAGRGCSSEDLFDILAVAPLVSVAVDASHREHWLISDGHWSIRLDLNEGTLLGGPVSVEHRIAGIVSAKPKLKALRQFIVLAQMGTLPASMMPRERKATQWILELRTGDALLDDAPQQDIARALFDRRIAPRRWRLDSASYRLRAQRLVKIAQRRLADPLGGPWFD